MGCGKNINDCGHFATCIGGKCSCLDGYVKSSVSTDCRDPKCTDPMCLQCASKSSCIRCVKYIQKDSGKCLDECPGRYNLVIEGPLLGKVCGASKKTSPNNDRTLYLGVIIGVVAVVVICLLVAAIIFIRIRRKKNNGASRSGQNKGAAKYQKRKEASHVYSNAAYVENYDEQPQGEEVYTITKVNSKEEYVKLVEELRPHGPTFVEMMNETRNRLKGTPPKDSNCQKYKNMLHQLWRVMTLINKKDPVAHMPQDGCALMSWAKKIVKKYLECQQNPQQNGSAPQTSPGQFCDKYNHVVQLDDEPATSEPEVSRVSDSFYTDLKNRHQLPEPGRRPQQVPVFEVMV